MSKKRYEIVSYDIPLWLKPVLSVTETSIYTGISANKIYEMSESEDCPFVICVLFEGRNVDVQNRWF